MPTPAQASSAEAAAADNLGPRLYAQVREALARGGDTHTVADVLDAVRRGDMQWWQGEESVVVTEIVRYPRATCLHVFAAAGDLGEIFGPLHDRLVEFGRRHGCDRMTAVARHGWSRAGRKLGFEPKWTAIAKGL